MPSETPRTWRMRQTSEPGVGWLVDGEMPRQFEVVKVYEASTVDAERERMLYVIKGLFEAVGITNLIASTVPEIQEAEAILREHHRLPKKCSLWCPVCHTYHPDPGEKTDAGQIARPCNRLPEEGS